MGFKINDASFSEVQEMAKKQAAEAARDVQRSLVEKYKSVVENFYYEYTPYIYDRFDNLKRNSYRPYYENDGRSFHGGIEIDANDMHENYNAPAIVVLETALSGYHGVPTYPGIKGTPMYDVMISYFDTLLMYYGMFYGGGNI